MKEGLLGATLSVSSRSEREEARSHVHAGLDLSRRRLDVCLLDEAGGLLAETAGPPDADGLRGLARRLAGLPVRAAIESMNGARFVHGTLGELGWEVQIARAIRVSAHVMRGHFAETQRRIRPITSDSGSSPPADVSLRVWLEQPARGPRHAGRWLAISRPGARERRCLRWPRVRDRRPRSTAARPRPRGPRRGRRTWRRTRRSSRGAPISAVSARGGRGVRWEVQEVGDRLPGVRGGCVAGRDDASKGTEDLDVEQERISARSARSRSARPPARRVPRFARAPCGAALAGRLVRETGELREDEVGHRRALSRGAFLQRAMELVRDVSNLDHLHVVHASAHKQHVEPRGRGQDGSQDASTM
jgi:hypothetical protein